MPGVINHPPGPDKRIFPDVVKEAKLQSLEGFTPSRAGGNVVPVGGIWSPPRLTELRFPNRAGGTVRTQSLAPSEPT